MPSNNKDTVSINHNKKEGQKEESELSSIVTQSFPPSHILQDGRFIYLPPPNEVERSRFFERAIAKYGLLESDMSATKASATAKEQQQQTEKVKQLQEEEEEDGTATKNDDTAPKVHPLALASARIQGSGISELNRAINLSTLVNTGEYFGLSNVVDPSLELGAAVPKAEGGTATTATTSASGATTGATGGSGAEGGTTGASTSTSAAATAATSASGVASTTPTAAAANAVANVPKSQAQKEMQQEQRVKSAYVLKRKRAVFDKASHVLKRHQSRLEAAITAQAVPDERLRQLRLQWRLVAPEHGTRAKPHAVRPTEVIAVDVDVYDPTGGSAGGSGTSLVGRLASQVPRFATIELTESFCQKEKQQKPKSESNNIVKQEEEEDEEEDKEDKRKPKDEDAMDVNEDDEKADVKMKDENFEKKKIDGKATDADGENDDEFSRWTIAEPFAIADPTLGKISTDFDPNKVTYLTLQFDIEKAASGFCMSSCLEPMTTTMLEIIKEQKQTAETDKDDDKNGKSKSKAELPEDEQVLVSLQHSLFCAKLFESIRKELMGDDTAGDQVAQQRQPSLPTQSQNQSVVWLTSESEENYLPPPSVMVQPDTHNTGAALSVVHCHSSEVKVQLDCEYTLRAKLVEADEQQKSMNKSYQSSSTLSNDDSGSQTSQQLSLLCRSLLLHAQEAYHKHSLQESFAAARKQREEEERKLQAEGKPMGLDRIRRKDIRKQPKILQSVVGLGSKMLFEQRIRKSLVRVSKWLRTNHPTTSDSIKTEWLSLSLFDMHSHFCLRFGTALFIDATIVRDEITVISYGSNNTGIRAECSSGEYRKIKFHSDMEFEIFLKLELRRIIRQKDQQAAEDVSAVVLSSQ